MYNILKANKITEMLNNLPRKREHITMEEVLEMRKRIGQGCSLCKRFLDKANNVDEAVELYHNIMKKLC